MRRTSSHRAAVASLVATVLAASAGCADDAASPGPTPQPSPAAAQGAAAIPYDGPVEPGTHPLPRSAWSVADLRITFPDDWTVQYGHVFHRFQDTDAEFGFYPVVVEEVYADPCRGSTGALREVGPGVDDLVGALRQQPGPRVGRPVVTELGGLRAVRVDLTLPPDVDLSDCNLGEIGLQIWHSLPEDKYLVLGPGTEASVYVLEVDGQRQVFVTQYPPDQPAADRRELARVLDSIEIGS